MGEGIELRILGSFDVAGLPTGAGERLFAQPRPAALLAYLAAANPGSYFRRDQLAGLFWAETGQERARTNLRKLIFTLRRSLGAAVLQSRGDEDLRLDPGAIWCDAAEYAAAMHQHRWSRMVELYKGSVLPGFHLAGSRGFQDWLDGIRRAYAREAVKAALSLAAAHAENRERTDVGDLVQFVMRLDSDIEDEYQLRKLLLLLEGVGDRSGALTLYEKFRQRMWTDFKAVPASETREVVARLRG